MRILRDRVILKRIPLPTQTKGGIHLPLSAVELPQLAHIKFVGPKNPDRLKPGDLVIPRKFEGRPIFIDNEDCVEMFIKDLLAIVED